MTAPLPCEERILAAVQQGQQWALGLKRGDVFLGARFGAEQAGYEMETVEYHGFVTGALIELERTDIAILSNGLIHSITRKGGSHASR